MSGYYVSRLIFSTLVGQETFLLMAFEMFMLKFSLLSSIVFEALARVKNKK